MGQEKEVNIKNQSYYFFGDMVDIRNFHSNLLKKDKKSDKNTDIYYNGYVTIKKFTDCKNIHSMNPLYLISHSANYKDYKDYKITKKFFLELDQRSKQLMVEKNCFMKKNMLELELILTMNYL